MGKREIHTLFNAKQDLFDYDIEKYCKLNHLKKEEEHLFIVRPKQDCKIIAREAKLKKNTNGDVTVTLITSEENKNDDGRRSFDAILIKVQKHKAVHFKRGIGEDSRKSTKLDKDSKAGTSKVDGA
uniref:Uncharacterized protein n=1 Tax=Acrobeloides nanus TaxID=290746 RepID=A0A914BWD6_9BILA